MITSLQSLNSCASFLSLWLHQYFIYRTIYLFLLLQCLNPLGILKSFSILHRFFFCANIVNYHRHVVIIKIISNENLIILLKIMHYFNMERSSSSSSVIPSLNVDLLKQFKMVAAENCYWEFHCVKDKNRRELFFFISICYNFLVKLIVVFGL